jgi:hypothetical protein
VAELAVDAKKCTHCFYGSWIVGSLREPFALMTVCLKLSGRYERLEAEARSTALPRRFAGITTRSR